MKVYSLIFSLILCFSSLSFSQNFTETFFNVNLEKSFGEPSTKLLREYFRCQVYPFHILAQPKSRAKLSAAQSMSDLMKEYPSSWVSNYISTEIAVVSNGKIKKEKGNNATLTKSQRTLLKSADLNTKVSINVKYEQENSATRKVEINNLNFFIAVVPDTEATYPNGWDALDEYLKKNAVDPIPDTDLRTLKRGTIEFVINKKGQVEAVQILEKTGKPKVDQLLLKAIKTMPQWKPAKDAEGMPIEQKFKFVAGGMDGC